MTANPIHTRTSGNDNGWAAAFVRNGIIIANCEGGGRAINGIRNIEISLQEIFIKFFSTNSGSKISHKAMIYYVTCVPISMVGSTNKIHTGLRTIKWNCHVHCYYVYSISIKACIYNIITTHS